MALKIGLTGATGFIGCHLVPALKQAGYEVVPFVGDLLDSAVVDKYFLDNPDLAAVVHLAGLAGGDNLSDLTKLNLEATVNLLAGLKGKEVKIVFASSGAVYGDAQNDSSSEDDPLLPNTAYGLTKVWAEQAINFAANQAVILRFSNIYGPGNKKGVMYWLRQGIATENQVKINGDGTQIRNFLYIDDAVKAIVLAVATDATGAFNISPNRSYSLNEVVDELKKSYQFEVVSGPADNQLQRLILNPDRAKELLGFTAEHEELKTDYEL